MAAAKSRKSPVEQSLNVDFLGGRKKKKFGVSQLATINCFRSQPTKN